MRGLRLAGAVLAVTAAAVGPAGCATGPEDGGKVASDIAAETATQLLDRFGRTERVRDAEYLAATKIPAGLRTGNEIRVTPLAWSGRTTGDQQATIDVRITATVPEQRPQSIGGRGHTAGRADRCYRYTLQLYRETGSEEITCPAVASPPVPSASPPLTLPADAAKRLTAVLRTATPATLAGAVRAAFPQDGITVETGTQRGTLVAAVGVPAERDCLVMIRTPGAEPKQVPFPRIQLEPGEAGCSTTLYTNPAR